MQYRTSTSLILLLLLYQYVAQDEIDELSDKNNKHAAEELLKKIDEISVQSFSNASYRTKLEMLRKIEMKLKKAASSLGNRGERYVKLIMKGIKAKLLENISDVNASKMQVEIPLNNNLRAHDKSNLLNENVITKISTESKGDIEKNIGFSGTFEYQILNRQNFTKDSFEYKDLGNNKNIAMKEYLRQMKVVSRGSNESQNREKIINREPSTEHVIESLTPRYDCEGRLDAICLNIKQMREMKCHFDDSVISIDKLCDGFSDCIDRTDEKFCTSQVTERIQNANQVLHQTDESFQLGCFPNKTKDSIMTSQIIILRSILQAQQKFVEKYKYFNESLITNVDYLKGEGTVKRAVNEIALIVSTLALALDAELCSQLIKTGDEFMARKFNDLLIEDFDKVIDDVESPPKSCTCKEERCENITTCTDTCKRVCWQKYGLTRWGCPSINESETVPLDVICDGKYDCYDRSDEKDCVTGVTYAKFEAHKIFKDILTSLSVKVTSKDYAFIRNMLLSLHSTIDDLQRYCMASEPDLKIIRMLRNKCFFSLSSIYSETLTKSSFLYQKSEVYVFLLSLHENIVNALKHSHMGNKRIIANDGCYCRDGRCSMPICSRSCQRSCIAEPWLTRYICTKYPNKSVPLEDICNGKPNCPKEDDEINCEKEICRRHHLSLIRHSLQKIGQKQKGTSMGELLTSWKIKASSTLLTAENDEKPNIATIRDIIREILNDLVITYGAVKDYRRDNEYALEEFTNIARHIMKFLRFCRY